MRRVYLDHNATSPLRPEARQAMIAAMDVVGNPSSVHAEGRDARRIIEDARERVAVLVGAAAKSIVFTSGGTEANVTALSPSWLAKGGRRLFVSAIEHASVLRGGRFTASDVELLPVDGDGIVDPVAARRMFQAQHGADLPFMLSVMAANNETGVVQPVTELAALAHEFGGVLHCDAVQAVGKITIDAKALGADLISLSAHKFGGPKGAGALAILNETLPVAALLTGGGQERSYRAGTENVAAIAGFGAAAEAALSAMDEARRLAELRDRLEAAVAEISPEVAIFGAGVARLPNTSCFGVSGMQAETLLIALDLRGIAVSAGSACSSGKVARSHVLDAMGAAPDLGAAAIRVSLGWNTGEDDIELFAASWAQIYEKFAARSRAA